jgi:hypothetical protein
MYIDLKKEKSIEKNYRPKKACYRLYFGFYIDCKSCEDSLKCSIDTANPFYKRKEKDNEQ